MTTSRVGTLAITEKRATSRRWSRPLPPIGDRAARPIATRRANSTISAIAGTRLATSSKATIGGVSKAPRLAVLLGDDEIADRRHRDQRDEGGDLHQRMKRLRRIATERRRASGAWSQRKIGASAFTWPAYHKLWHKEHRMSSRRRFAAPSEGDDRLGGSPATARARKIRTAWPAPLWIAFLVERVPELGGAVQTLGVPADMLARAIDADLGAIMVEHRSILLDDEAILLVHAGFGEPLARSSASASPGRAARAGHRRRGRSSRRRRPDWSRAVSTSSIEQMSPLTITGRETACLTLRTNAPVGLALVELAAGAAVDGDHLHAEILGDAGELGRVEAGMIPAHPHLQRHRDLHRLRSSRR